MSGIRAGDAAFDRHIQRLSESVQGRVRYHSITLPDGSVLPGLQTPEHLEWRLGLFNLPADLRGKTVLDIGAWDGWFSFECERRGARVVAVDCVELDTFLEARRLLGSQVEYLTLDINELSARRLGRFDIVLFFGVLYHLRHPLLGLEKALELSSDMALIESFVIAPESRPVPAVMEFYERAELGGQMDNWCGPSPECLLAMCRSAGFAHVELRDITSNRASVICRRHWPEPAHIYGPAPHLHSAVNNRTWLPLFHPLKDEYLCCYFKSPEGEITPDSLRIEVDGFGVPALSVSANGAGAWQANCVRPPGLDPGRHRVTLRVRDGLRSNTVEFAMLDENGDSPAQSARDLPAAAPDLCSVEYRPPGDLRLAGHRGGSLICYFRSPADSLEVSDIEVQIAGAVFHPSATGSLEENVWQANILLDRSPDPETLVRLRVASGEWSDFKPLSQGTVQY